MSIEYEVVNTKLEAYRLVHDPTKLLSLLFSKYGDIEEDYYLLYTNQILYNKLSHYNTLYKEIQIEEYIDEFLKRFYHRNESVSRIPKLSDYYKNYHLFFCKPNFVNYHISNLMHNYQDKKAEVFYKDNYADSKSKKSNREDIKNNNTDSYDSSSLSSLDNITDNKTIFTKKNKMIIDNNLDENLMTMTLTLDSQRTNANMSKKNEEGLISQRSQGKSFELMVKNLIEYKVNKTKSRKNNQKNDNRKNIIASLISKLTQIHPSQSSINQLHSKNYNMNNQLKVNKIKASLYTLAHKNYLSNNKNRNLSSDKNKIYFSSKDTNKNLLNYNQEMSDSIKQSSVIPNKDSNNGTTIHKRNKTCNLNNANFNSGNNTNYNNFAKLSATLNNNKFVMNNNFMSVTSNLNSQSTSQNMVQSANSIKKCVNKITNLKYNQFIPPSTKMKNTKRIKNKTFDINFNEPRLEQNFDKINRQNFNSPLNKNHLNTFNQNCKVISISQNLNGTDNNYLYQNKNIPNGSKFNLVKRTPCQNNSSNKIPIKHIKNSISYTNNNFNINFNNVYFCSQRSNSNSSNENVNVNGRKVFNNNFYLMNLNNIYNVSRNKNVKIIYNKFHTQGHGNGNNNKDTTKNKKIVNHDLRKNQRLQDQINNLLSKYNVNKEIKIRNQEEKLYFQSSTPSNGKNQINNKNSICNITNNSSNRQPQKLKISKVLTHNSTRANPQQNINLKSYIKQNKAINK